MAQESQGLHRRPHARAPDATDIGVVHFRRLMLEGRRRCSDGEEPAAARASASYRLRSGGAVAPSNLSFEEVMKQRFGSATGRVPS